MINFIFDLDGTIQDSGPRSGYPLANAMKTVLGIEVPREEILCHMDGFDHGWYRTEYEMTDEQHERIQQLMHEGFQRAGEEGLDPLFEGSVEMLDELLAAGATLHVCSARAIANIDERMQGYGIRDRFTHLMGKRDWSHNAKEKAEVLCESVQRLGLDPKTCVMIGDLPGDIRAGQAAGMRTIAVTYGFASQAYLEPYHPDYFVRSIAELRELLLRLTAEAKTALER